MQNSVTNLRGSERDNKTTQNHQPPVNKSLKLNPEGRRRGCSAPAASVPAQYLKQQEMSLGGKTRAAIKDKDWY